MQTSGGKQYGDCKVEHGNGKGKFCYVKLPTNCSDAETSKIDSTTKLSFEACRGKFLSSLKMSSWKTFTIGLLIYLPVRFVIIF